MSAIALGVGLAGVGASLYNGSQARKQAASAANSSQVDIAALDQFTRDLARRNAIDSSNLERMLTPEVPQLRTDANNLVSSQMNPSGVDQYTTTALDQLARSNVSLAGTPLLAAAIEKARANLALGGRLSQDTRNETIRSGLATAGTVGRGNLGLGRDITARDLGLRSLDLENQRLTSATNLGGLELQRSQADADTSFNNRANILNALQLLQATQGNQFNRALSAAQYGQSIAPPVVGLDPASAGNLAVGNANNASAAHTNAANIYGASSNNFLNTAGNLFGAALLNYNRTGSGGYPEAVQYGGSGASPQPAGWLGRK